jgi:GNAT superfamily N-acetyltransferase
MVAIKIRPAQKSDSVALGRILVTANQNAFQGRVPDRCLNSLTPDESAHNWAKSFVSKSKFDDCDKLFVAEVSCQVVGLAMLSESQTQFEGYSHELNTLQVEPAWQLQGIGRKLITRIALEMWKDRKTPLLVGVLAENPNHEFYRNLGAIQLGTRPYNWEGYQTEEIIYGFGHVQVLFGIEKD